MGLWREVRVGPFCRVPESVLSPPEIYSKGSDNLRAATIKDISKADHFPESNCL